MPNNTPVRRTAIVGAGVICASWAAEFLAHGFDFVATAETHDDVLLGLRQLHEKYAEAASVHPK